MAPILPCSETEEERHHGDPHRHQRLRPHRSARLPRRRPSAASRWSRSTTSSRPTTSPTCSSYDTMQRRFRLGGRPAEVSAPRTASPSTAGAPRACLDEGTRRAAVEEPGRRLRPRVDRALHRLREGERAPRRPGAKRVIISAPTKSGPDAGADRLPRRQRRRLRPREAHRASATRAARPTASPRWRR